MKQINVNNNGMKSVMNKKERLAHKYMLERLDKLYICNGCTAAFKRTDMKRDNRNWDGVATICRACNNKRASEARKRNNYVMRLERLDELRYRCSKRSDCVHYEGGVGTFKDEPWAEHHKHVQCRQCLSKGVQASRAKRKNRKVGK